MYRRLVLAGLLSASVVGGSACQRGPTSTPELQALLASETPPEGVNANVWADATTFYAAREATLAWVAGNGPTEKTFAALDTLRAAEQHGLDPQHYDEAELRTLASVLDDEEGDPEERAEQLARLDVALTSALLELGRHVATGRLEPASIDPRWNTKREPPDYVAALQHASEGEDTVPLYLDAIEPRHPEYRALREHLTALRARSGEGWPTVPRASMKVGQWNGAVVPPLRERLAAGGYVPSTAPMDSAQYDAEIETAVKAFQKHHGLAVTGTLDRATIHELNVPLDGRLTQIAINLERWRWMPDDLGSRHFLVNVPEFHLYARENGRTALDMRVVVGKRGNETPLFADEMETVVFSPYWNVPETIALEETAPAVQRDPAYLARNNMEVIDASGRVVPPEVIPWGDEAALEGYRFRQRPGAGNALGYVKFLFPNRHAVYLHDTPADALFKRIGRAFSHGCVRVEEPERLARYVLRDQSKWSDDAIRAAMRAGTERHVRLTEKIPIYLVYMTAFVHADGALYFRDDVYGYDARQARL